MRSQPNRDYQSNDAVMTPPGLAQTLVAAIAPHGVALDPCAGDRAFVLALEAWCEEVYECEIRRGTDFFAWSRHVDWVVSNPPWSQFARFLQHGLLVADNVALLATVNHWWTKRRVRNVLNGGFGYRRLVLVDWPSAFPTSGFQLGMMHVQRGYAGPLGVVDLRTEQTLRLAEPVA